MRLLCRSCIYFRLFKGIKVQSSPHTRVKSSSVYPVLPVLLGRGNFASGDALGRELFLERRRRQKLSARGTVVKHGMEMLEAWVDDLAQL